MKLPHMPLWVYDIDTDRDCRRMPDATFGRYMRLLIRQWIEGSVPATPAEAIRDAVLDPDCEADVQSLLDRKFREHDGGVRRNGRLEAERTAALAKCEKRRDAGRMGGNARANAIANARAPATANAIANGSTRAYGSGSGSDSSSDSPQKVKTGKDQNTIAAAKNRPRDEVWDAIAAAFYPSGVSSGERSHVNRIVRDLREKGATSAEIERRTANYRRNWPTMTLTAEALLKHWDVHAKGPPGGSGQAAEKRRAEWLAKMERERAEVPTGDDRAAAVEEMRQARRKKEVSNG